MSEFLSVSFISDEPTTLCPSLTGDLRICGEDATHRKIIGQYGAVVAYAYRCAEHADDQYEEIPS